MRTLENDDTDDQGSDEEDETTKGNPRILHKNKFHQQLVVKMQCAPFKISAFLSDSKT